MKLSSRTSGLALLLLAAAGLAGVPGQTLVSYDNVYSPLATDDLPLPVTGTQGYDELQLVNLLGNEDRGGVLFSQARAYFLHAVEYSTTSQLLSVAVSAFAVETEGASTGNDAILLSTPAGLERVEYDPISNTIPAPTLVHSAPSWQNASLLFAQNFRGGPRPDLIHVDPANDKLAHVSQGQPDGSFASVVDILLPRTIRDVDVIDWDLDGVQDFAFLTDIGLSIYDDAGNSLHTALAPPPAGAICSLPPSATQAGNFLAWARRDATNSYHEFELLHPSSIRPAQRLHFLLDSGQALTDINPLELRRGDCDGDGDPDIAVIQDSIYCTIIMGNRGGSVPQFTTNFGDYALIALSETPEEDSSGLTAIPAFGDFTNDGRADILYPDAKRDKAVMDKYLPTFPSSPGSPPLPAIIDPHVVVSESYGYNFVMGVPEPPPDPDPWEGPLVMNLDLPSSAWDDGYTHIQVQVWEQPNTNSDLNSAAIQNRLYPLSAVPQPTAGNVTPAFMEVECNTEEMEQWNAGLHYWINWRFVEADDTDQNNPIVLSFDEWQGYAFTMDPGDNPSNPEAYKDYLDGLQFASAQREVDSYDSQPDNVSGDTNVTGWGASVSRFPTFDSATPTAPALELVPAWIGQQP